MTRYKIKEHKANMDKITENLGGVKEDIWQDPYKLANYLYMIAECLSELLIDKEREETARFLGYIEGKYVVESDEDGEDKKK